MRVVCLDVGERRIGVAVTDALDLTAQGVETIWCDGLQRDSARVREICDKYQTNRLVLGLPRNMDGSIGFQAQRVQKFAEHLKSLGFEIRFQDERMTTKQATSVLLEADMRREKRRNVVDMLAATYILQSFMDSGGWKKIKKPFLGGKYKMLDNENMNNEPQDQDEYGDQDNLVVLVDEDGNEVTFEHLMTLEHKGKNYICLVPAEEMEDVEEDELVIMRIETDDEGNDYYSTIESDDELEEVFDAYLKIAEEDDE